MAGGGRPVLYLDLLSVYAYLGCHRAPELIPDADWKPVLVAALQKQSGRTTWFLTDEREARMAEAERRAAAYGLPPITWPAALPANTVGINRAAVVAKREGKLEPFAAAAFRTMYVEGQDNSTPEAMRRQAEEAGLDPDALLEAIVQQDVKDELRANTDEAFAHGAIGVPSVVVGEQAFWGDDRLEEAAAAARASR